MNNSQTSEPDRLIKIRNLFPEIYRAAKKHAKLKCITYEQDSQEYITELNNLTSTLACEMLADLVLYSTSKVQPKKNTGTGIMIMKDGKWFLKESNGTLRQVNRK